MEQLLLDIKQTCDCMPRIVADNALSEDDEDDDANTATVMESLGDQDETEQECAAPKPQAVQFNLLAAAKAYSQKVELTGMDCTLFDKFAVNF